MKGINRTDGLTDNEGEIMDLLVKAWNKYIELPIQHKSECNEFVEGVHICQNLLAIRIARRHYPKGWPIKK